MKPTPNNAIRAIRAMFDAASTATGFVARIPPGFVEPTSYVPAPAVSGGTLNIQTTQLPDLFAADGTWRGVQPIATPAGQVLTLRGALAASSRVVNAGAHLIIEDPTAAKAVAGIPGAVSRQIEHFTTVEAAQFAAVLDDADVATTALPSFKSEVRFGASKQRAVRFELKKKDRHTYGDEQMAAEVLASLALGIARAADAAFLAELQALDEIGGLILPFSIGAAAAQGLKFADLQAIVGTAGTGAMVTADGRMACLPFNTTGYQAGGIPAELTGDTAATYVGAWNRAAVALNDEIPVTVARIDKAGTIAVTAWVNVLPLIPQPGKLFRVVAA